MARTRDRELMKEPDSRRARRLEGEGARPLPDRARSSDRWRDYSAIEKREGRACFAFDGRSTRGLAPRMNSTAQSATIAQTERSIVKTFISNSS